MAMEILTGLIPHRNESFNKPAKEGVRWKYAIIIFTVWKYAIGISLTGGCHHSH
jgi:hypothetical protein